MKIQRLLTIAPNGKEDYVGYVKRNTSDFMLICEDVMELDNTYMVSFSIKSTEAKTISVNGTDVTISDEWARYTVRIKALSTSLTFVFPSGEYYLYKFKLEHGTLATDWVQSMEDVIADAEASSGLGRWAYDNNMTYIDGGKIYTGTIKAHSIDVDNLFAQDITATGTIEGATLQGASIIGASGEFSKSFSVDIPSEDGRQNFKVYADDDELFVGTKGINSDASDFYLESRLEQFENAYGEMVYLPANRIVSGGEKLQIEYNLLEFVNHDDAGGSVFFHTGAVIEENCVFSVFGDAEFHGNVSTDKAITTTSDERVKKLHDIDSSYEKLFDNITPTLYEFIDGDGKTHIGFGAQSVVKALDDAGIDIDSFGGVSTDKRKINGIEYDDFHGLAYSEFIALNTHMIKKLQKENQELKEQVSNLSKKIDYLMSKVDK